MRTRGTVTNDLKELLRDIEGEIALYPENGTSPATQAQLVRIMSAYRKAIQALESV